MFRMIGTLINLFVLWLIIGLLGAHWVNWWEFAEYTSASAELISQVFDFLGEETEKLRQYLISVGEEAKKGT